jgi:hypothetical protein
MLSFIGWRAASCCAISQHGTVDGSLSTLAVFQTARSPSFWQHTAAVLYNVMDIPGINMSTEFSRLHLSMVAIIMRIPVPILWNAGYIHNELTSWEEAHRPKIIFLCIPDTKTRIAFRNVKKGQSSEN